MKFDEIETLNLTLGKLRYTDMAHPANNTEVPLNVQNEIFHHIKTEGDLYGVMMVLMLKGTCSGLTWQQSSMAYRQRSKEAARLAGALAPSDHSGSI